MGEKPIRHLSDEEFQARIHQRRLDRMARIDAMPADLRELVHDYGLRVIDTCLDLGVKKPRHIRHLVEAVLDEFSPTRGSHSSQGTRAHIPPPPERAP